MRYSLLLILLIIVSMPICAADVQTWLLQQQKKLQQLQENSIFKEGITWAKQKTADNQTIQTKPSLAIQNSQQQMSVGSLPKQAYPDCQPLIFISFSMPKHSIDLWLMQAKRYHGAVILRGLVHNSFKETASLLKDILRISHYGIQLNPMLFTKYNINSAPAVVLAQGNQYDIVTGDIPLEDALEAIAESGSVCQQTAKILLTKAKPVQP